MNKLVKVISSVSCTALLLLGTNVSTYAKQQVAQDGGIKCDSQAVENGQAKFSKLGNKVDNLDSIVNTQNHKEINNKSRLQSSVRQHNLLATATTATDAYEPNNGSAAAKQIPYNQEISANIGDSADQDWYAVNLTSGTGVAFLLKGIPTGCDYNLAIISPDHRVGYSKNVGNANEKFYLNIDMTGTWYVVVYNTSTNYNASTNYSLFVGDAWATATSEVIPTNLEFKFTERDLKFQSEWQILDLRNYPGIPSSALVRSISLLHGDVIGNPGCLTKFIAPEQDPDKCWNTFSSGQPVLNFPQDKYNVKQRWGIKCWVESFIGKCTYVQVKPKIQFTYIYIRE